MNGTPISMRRLGMIAAVLFFFASLAYGQSSCVRCVHSECTGTSSGGCGCDDGGGVCAICGFCAGGCHQPCPFIVSNDAGIKESLWFTNQPLADKISEHSFTLGLIFGQLQEKMIRTGKQYLREGQAATKDKQHEVNWTALHPNGSQIAEIMVDGQLPPDRSNAPNRLVLGDKRWELWRDEKHLWGLATSRTKIYEESYY